MQHIKFTYVDALTGVPVTQAPAVNGPAMPAVPGLEFVFARESAYPTGTPHFFGTCPDGIAPSVVPGVLAVLTEAEFEQARADELEARRTLLRTRVNAERDRLEAEGFPHAGLWFQSDERSVARLNSTALTASSALLAGQSPAFPDWLAADNTPLPVDAQGVLALQSSLTLHAGALHQRARAIKAQIDAAQDFASLAAVDTGGWPGA